MCYNQYVPKERNKKLKEVVIMANKKTVMEQYDAIKVMLNGGTVEGYTVDEAVAFIEKRIEITRKKNASKSTEPTPKQKEKMAVDASIENAIVAVMEVGTQYSPTDLLKMVDDVGSTQKLTPRLTALVNDGKLTKATVKGRTVYSLVE